MKKSDKALPAANGVCWCGCNEGANPGKYFRPGHDRRASERVIHEGFGGLVMMLLELGMAPTGAATEPAPPKAKKEPKAPKAPRTPSKASKAQETPKESDDEPDPWGLGTEAVPLAEARAEAEQLDAEREAEEGHDVAELAAKIDAEASVLPFTRAKKRRS